MQLKTKPIVLALILIFGLTIVIFLLISNLHYTSPAAVTNYIKSHPADVAITCLDPSGARPGYSQNETEAFPLAATFKLVVLAAYADEVAAGHLNPDELIPLGELDKYFLPGSAGDAQPEFLKSLGPGRATLSLDEIAEGMMAYGSTAALEYIETRLSSVDYPTLYLRLGLETTGQPSSFLGLRLLIKNHETGLYNTKGQLTPRQIGQEQARLAGLYINDQGWRQAERNFTGNPANAAPLPVQKEVLNTFGVRGSARDISRILLAAYGYNQALPPEAQDIMRKHLEWPERLNPESAKSFQTLGSVGGAWPGVLTSAWYGEAFHAGPRVLVVLYRNLPDDFWNAWATSSGQQQLEIEALTNADCSLFSK